jgi:hypothetical protein
MQGFHHETLQQFGDSVNKIPLIPLPIYLSVGMKYNGDNENGKKCLHYISIDKLNPIEYYRSLLN